MRVAFRAQFDSYSPDGQNAVELAVALDEAGVDVVPFPLTCFPGLPPRFSSMLSRDPWTTQPDVEIMYCDMNPAQIAPPLPLGRRVWISSDFTDTLPPLPYEKVFGFIPTQSQNHLNFGINLNGWDPGLRPHDLVFGTFDDNLPFGDVYHYEMPTTRENRRTLYHQFNVLIQTHVNPRVAVEYMATGGYVIAPHHPVTETFINDATSTLVEPVGATVNYEQVRWEMNRLTPTVRDLKSNRGARHVRSACSVDRTAEQLIRGLRD